MSHADQSRNLPSVLSAVMMLLGAGIATVVTVGGTGLGQVAAAGIVGSLLIAVGGYALYTRHVLGLVFGTTAVIGAALAFLAIGLPLVQGRGPLTIVAGCALVGAWYAVGLLASGSASLPALRRVRRALVRSVVVLWVVAGGIALVEVGGIRAASQAALQVSGEAFRGLTTIPVAAPPVVLLFVLAALLAGNSLLRAMIALELTPGDLVPSRAIRRSITAVFFLLIVTTVLTLPAVKPGGPSSAVAGAVGVYLQVVVPVFSSPLVLAGAIGLAVAACLVRLGLAVLGWIRAARLATVGRSTMRLLPAVGVVVAILVATPRGLLLSRLQTVPAVFSAVTTVGLKALLLGAIGGALAPLLAALVTVRVLRGLQLIPDTRAFAGIASAGFVTAVIVAATSLSQTALVAVGIGGALLIWDSAEFGVQLARDLDTRLAVTPNEFVHHGMSLAVVGVAAALVIVVTNLTRPVATLLQTAAAAESTLGQSPLILILLLGGVILLLLGFNAARPT
ncbi:hypothetical protein [Halosegnis sp.]|uniref:hypothetical protein n=1 Tax=Halosegnis sp. TaxID=2864959 RepID=UPI0035D48AA7